ncbi:MAG TPA: ribosome recycling factor, partial [Terriglobia bacterium]|nr:ribosome recycling factor [Terriglobia bacterium]
MSAKDEIGQCRRHMEKAIEDLRTKLATIRTGRASISILDRVQVEYYGVPTPLNQVAQLAVPEPTQITVQPYDVSLVGPIEKAIRSSDLNLNPSNDGRIVRVPIPPLTEERRKELVKVLHKKVDDAKTAVRNIRRDVHDKLRDQEKKKEISADELKRGTDRLQKLTDKFIEDLDGVGHAKEREI